MSDELHRHQETEWSTNPGWDEPEPPHAMDEAITHIANNSRGLLDRLGDLPEWEISLRADVEAIRSGRMRTVPHEQVKAEFGLDEAPDINTR